MGKLKDLLIGKKKQKEESVSKYAESSTHSETDELRAELAGLNRRLASVQSDAAKERRERQVSKIAGFMKRSVPKGIKNPDQTVRNLDLYVGGPLSQSKVYKGKKRLF